MSFRYAANCLVALFILLQRKQERLSHVSFLWENLAVEFVDVSMFSLTLNHCTYLASKFCNDGLLNETLSAFLTSLYVKCFLSQLLISRAHGWECSCHACKIFWGSFTTLDFHGKFHTIWCSTNQLFLLLHKCVVILILWCTQTDLL